MQQFFIGTNQAGQRLDKYLAKLLPESNKSFLYKMLRKKNITLNKKKAVGNEILCLNDEINCFFSDETFAKFSARKENDYSKAYHLIQGIKVLYEDDNILALHKPVGVLSQKAKEEDVSINEWLIGYLLEVKFITEDDLCTFKPSICNRLDRNTSGIVLCGKTLIGSQTLNNLIAKRVIKKFYRTICFGQILERKKINGFLKKDELSNKVTITSTQVEGSDLIETSYTPLLSTKEATYLEVELITGKTHQIRAHLASILHPIVGDYKYDTGMTKKSSHLAKLPRHQLLHAYRVEFPTECVCLPKLSKIIIIDEITEEFEMLKSQLFDGKA